MEQSKANMAGLLNKAEDLSLEKEAIHLKSCEDAVLRANAYKWCKRCLRGAWARITLEAFSVQYIRYYMIISIQFWFYELSVIHQNIFEKFSKIRAFLR